MAEFGPEIAADVVSTAQAGVSEAVEALNRAFDGQFELQVGEAGVFKPAEPPEDFAGPGLAFVLKVPGGAALLTLSESSGLLPPWYAEPDATGVSKLMTLAQELGMVLLPDEFMPEDFLAQRVSNLAEAVVRGGVPEEASLVSLTLSSGEKKGDFSLIWPVPQADAVLKEAADETAAAPESPAPQQPQEAAAPTPQAAVPTPAARTGDRRIQYDDIEDGLRQLPSYARSILKVEVPLIVTLASTKQPVSRIVELGPGSIIQFDKSCEETLSLEVGGHEIAVGEAVKVGDKFGLRITSMIMPEERFWTVRGKRGVEKAVGRKGEGSKKPRH